MLSMSLINYIPEPIQKAVSGVENKAIQYRIIRDIRTLFEQQEETDFYKRIRAGSFWNKNSVKYQSSGDRNKNLSMKEYLDKLNHT